MITQDLGIATAYGYAKSKGYTGTVEEYAELMASYATVAQQAAQSASAAETAKTNAEAAQIGAETAKAGAETAAQNINGRVEQIDTNTADIADVKADLSELESDGVVASAEQLLSDKYTIDQTPYLYRRTNSNGADRAYEEIVGGSLVWNQISTASSVTASGVTATVVNGVITLNGTTTSTLYYRIGGISTVSGHAYLIVKNQNKEVPGSIIYNDNKGIGVPHTIDAIVQKANGVGNIFLRADTETVFDNYIMKPQIIDLTQMFGSTIADYIYSIEQASVGAGVAFFRNLFPEDYYSYDAGTMRHVSGVSAKETVGKNLLKQTTPTYSGLSIIKNPDGSYSVNGKPSSSGNFYFWNDANDPIVIKEESVFTTEWNPGGSATIVLGTRDNANAVRIEYADTANVPAGEYTVFRIYVSSAVTYSFTIKPMMRLASVPDATFKPYIKHTYPLDSSLTLRGIPKLDSNNQLYYDGDTYASDGTITRRYGIVDLGTLAWARQSSDGLFYSGGYPPMKANTANGILSNGMRLLTTQSAVTATDKSIYKDSNGRLYAHDSAYTTAAAFQTAISGVYLVYELATPTTETAEPYTNPQICDPYGTEEFVSTSIVPVGHYTKYPENLRAKIEGLPWDLSMIAPVETGTKASQAYAVGKYFLLNNKFCKAKTAIASEATFTLNTNYTVTTVADELYTALH